MAIRKKRDKKCTFSRDGKPYYPLHAIDIAMYHLLSGYQAGAGLFMCYDSEGRTYKKKLKKGIEE